MRRITHALPLALVASLIAAAPAAAAPPPNDARTAPQAITLPANVRGVTAEATLDADEPGPSCAPGIKNSVWYAFTASADRGILAALDAGGEMDAVVEVFQRERSQVTPVVVRPDEPARHGDRRHRRRPRRELPDPRRAARQLGDRGLLAARRRARPARAAARARAPGAAARTRRSTASRTPTTRGPSACGRAAPTASTPSRRAAAAPACRSTGRARPASARR